MAVSVFFTDVLLRLRTGTLGRPIRVPDTRARPLQPRHAALGIPASARMVQTFPVIRKAFGHNALKPFLQHPPEVLYGSTTSCASQRVVYSDESPHSPLQQWGGLAVRKRIIKHQRTRSPSKVISEIRRPLAYSCAMNQAWQSYVSPHRQRC